MPLSRSPGNGPKKPFSWAKFSKTLALWVLLLLIPVVFISYSSGGSDSAQLISYTQYGQELDHDNISKVTIQGGSQVVCEFNASVTVAGAKPAAKK